MKKYDLIVVGGGITGVAASVCASRLGMKVLLVEKCGSLGGAMTQSLVFPYMKFTADNGKKLLSDGVFTEMRRRKEKYKDSSWETYRFVFDDMIEESGVDVLFHSTVFAIGTRRLF
jgi:phytoene dehydrogenase-like protein